MSGLPLWVQYGSLLDLYVLVAGSILVRVLLRRGGINHLWAAVVGFLVVLDLASYYQAVPLEHSLLSPVARWWAARSMGLGSLLGVFMLVVFALLLVRAMRKRKVVQSMVWGLVVLLVLGFRTAYSQKGHYSASLIPVEGVPAEALDALQAAGSPQLLIARAFVDRNHGTPAVAVRDGDFIVVALDPAGEDPFFFRNARDFDEARRDPRFVRGTFREPCRMLAGWTTDSPGRYPLDPRIKAYPVSTTAIRVEGFAYRAIEREIEVFRAVRAGQIEMSYNLPTRGAARYSNDNADGSRTFRIWVVGEDEFKRCCAQRQEQ